MVDVQFCKHIVCPKSYGGCGASDKWKVSLDLWRVMLDCSCTFRLSLPLDMEKIQNFCISMPLEYDQSSKVIP